MLTVADSTLERMEPFLSARLGQTVEDGSTGGDRVGDVLARAQTRGRGKQLIIRTGHNRELRSGQIDLILDTIRKIAACGSDYVVLELGMTSDIAIPESNEARRVRGYRDEVCRRLTEEHGDRYIPIHQLLLAEARLYTLTPADKRWVDNGMLPEAWWAPMGTNGHYSDEARAIAADKLVPFLRWRFLGGPKPGNTAPPVPTPLPPVPDPEPSLVERIREWLRNRRRKL